jgi:psp operon transcriptional activator
MQLIDEALSLSQGHQGRAADLLGLSYHQFRGLLKKHEYGRKPGKAADPESGTPVSGPVRAM